ncbi:MAG: hypothetical protein ACJ8KF_03910 [Chthoniobacterales bacterium]
MKVHFLQDALGCDAVHGRAIKLMKRAGVAVEIFRFVHFSRINFRTHRKILVIDGTRGFYLRRRCRAVSAIAVSQNENENSLLLHRSDCSVRPRSGRVCQSA